MEEAQRTGAKVFFADEDHFRADPELRGKWVLKGEPALVDSTGPSYGEKASYYSAVCLETAGGGVDGCFGRLSRRATATAKRRQPSWNSCGRGTAGRLNVIWDNAPAHRGEAVRGLLRKPGLNLRLINLPGYSPDFNAGEGHLGLGERGGHRQSVPGEQGRRTGEGRRLPGRAGWA